MSGQLHTAQEVFVDTEGSLVVMHIVGAGTMKMPRDAAHGIARQLMDAVSTIDKQAEAIRRG